MLTNKVLFFIFILLLSIFLSAPASAAVNAQITSINPPSGVTVDADATFPLAVAVTYDVSPKVAQQVGGYLAWVTIDGKASSMIPFAGPGSNTFQFTIKAPSTQGVYTLAITLYIATKPDYQQTQSGQIFDTATFTYQVKPKVVTDWDVEKVWITPESPSPGDEVTFHARIALRSTTSTQSLDVDVMCYVDKKQFIQAPITLLFKPTAYTQDVTVTKKWVAAEGEHELVFTVDQLKRHNDPTPYPRYNFRGLLFRVEPYYAVIHDFKNPTVVDPGETFDVVVGVDYKFPDDTPLRISHSFPANATAIEQFDTVMGDSISSYTYSVTAPTPPPAVPGESDLMGYNGSAWVEFDRGAGWQHTDPGWVGYYVVMVRRPTYYAVFDSVEGTFLEPSFSSSSEKADLGRFSITMNVRYLLPIETGLRLIVTGFNGSSEVLRVEETITQTESTERTATYTYEYTFPVESMYEGDYMIGFDASVEYLVEGTWYTGDDETFNVSVSILHPEESIERPSQNILDDIRKAFLDFYEWWRRFFE